MTQVGQVAKLARDPNAYVRTMRYFPSARAAFAAYLRAEGITSADTILLPSYIGWSSREGSGVFDPVLEAGCQYAFYRMTAQLAVDQEDFARKLEAHAPRVVVMIHYFGFPDPRLARLVELAHHAGAKVLEDEAHALLSDWIGGICGRFGDAVIISLHKLLPVPTGGLLVLNRPIEEVEKASLGGDHPTDKLLDYDYAGIAERRRLNSQLLAHLLRPLAGRADLLIDALPPGVAPQTLPVLIRTVSRDQLYCDLNDAGFGVVSLYHTLVRAISRDEFPDSYQLSRHILNLPVHQDVRPEQLAAMVDELGRRV